MQICLVLSSPGIKWQLFEIPTMSQCPFYSKVETTELDHNFSAKMFPTFLVSSEDMW